MEIFKPNQNFFEHKLLLKKPHKTIYSAFASEEITMDFDLAKYLQQRIFGTGSDPRIAARIVGSSGNFYVSDIDFSPEDFAQTLCTYFMDTDRFNSRTSKTVTVEVLKYGKLTKHKFGQTPE